jgi:hypothetical protein
MDFDLKQYNGKNKGDFYIQCKGLHSGRPLINAIPNCFTVQSKDVLLKEKVYALFVARVFEPIICGSVIPFIKTYETKHLIHEQASKIKPIHEKQLLQIRNIDNLILSTEQQIKLYKQMQKALVFSMLK